MDALTPAVLLFYHGFFVIVVIKHPAMTAKTQCHHGHPGDTLVFLLSLLLISSGLQ